MRNDLQEQVFVNVHGCPLPPQECINITVLIDGEEQAYKAAMFLGGQRFLLEDDGGNAIIGALYSNQPVMIKIGPYSKEFEPGEFGELYKR